MCWHKVVPASTTLAKPCPSIRPNLCAWWVPRKHDTSTPTGPTLAQHRVDVWRVLYHVWNRKIYYNVHRTIWAGARSMLEPRYIDASATSKTTPGQSLCVFWVCCTGPPCHRGEKCITQVTWKTCQQGRPIYVQRRFSAGPTSSIEGQRWTSTAPMPRICRDVYRKVWLYNLRLQ